MNFGFFSFGGGEIFIVLIAVLVLFGANKIPELARMLGKGMNEFRRATDDLKREFKEGADDFKKDWDESKADIDNHVREISKTLSDDEGYEPYSHLNQEEAMKKNPDAISEDSTQPDDRAQPRENLKDNTTHNRKD
ncbi:twin arginine-targeting protein translocase, TatA/E family [Saccharicrinis carchari]|uniref:Sec-independent protein translocase protein TatA n=1 Tax=Saccharicrinis carchari TaxID=1168039 RepID=A0A521DC45_SACCC|nr:twin-arginine translocase TatA/TatE family subunit [Saccharicrinis carchari]SMO69152.1 twin arginine-targeting protein translocase, TatA/E family [Saccharicrinis carchari]